MFASLQRLFETHVMAHARKPEAGEQERALRYATATLLVELARADFEFSARESEHIQALLRGHFQLSPSEVAELIAAVEHDADKNVCLFESTRLMNEGLSQAEKEQIVELLWRVAFGDSVLDKYEEHFVRRVADLLYVSHGRFIRAKHRAAEAGED